jgi:hypothetical protein
MPGVVVGHEPDFLIFQELPNRGARFGCGPGVAVRAFVNLSPVRLGRLGQRREDTGRDLRLGLRGQEFRPLGLGRGDDQLQLVGRHVGITDPEPRFQARDTRI